MSELRANTISDAAGTGPATLTGQYAAKAWVNFNGTGTVAIRESGNVSSITDRGTGSYTVNLTSAMDSTNYAFSSAANVNSAATQCVLTENATGKTASALLVYSSYATGTLVDTVASYVMIQGDLA